MATSKNITVKGKIINKDKQPVANIRIEAWDKDLLVDDFVGEATSDTSGDFSIAFTQKRFMELFLDAKPDLYFKLYYKDKFLYSTEKEVVWNINSPKETVTIEIPARVKLPGDTTIPPAGTGNNEYTVSGRVVKLSGEPVAAARLVAVDVDLKGAALYRKITSQKELRSGEGFELIGEGISDKNGGYSIKFTTERYAAAERGEADVVVYAVDGDKVIGRSQLIGAKDYSDKGQVKGLIVFITKNDGRTEYELLMSKLEPFLAESKVTLADLAASSDQLRFAAAELGVPAAQIQVAVDAEVLRGKPNSTAQPLSHELLYGIGRQQIQLSWIALYKKKDEVLKAAIGNSSQAGIISAISEQEINAFLEALHTRAVAYSLEHKKTNTETLDKLLANALPDKNQRLAFANAARSFKGSDYQQFWNDYLPSVKEFKNKPGLIADLLLTQQLLLISGNHNALISELQLNRKISSPTELLELDAQQWTGILKKTGVPDYIKADTEEQRAALYTRQIENVLNAAFPTQKIAVMLKKGELPVENSTVAKGVSTFLDRNTGFDISASRIHEFDKEIRDAAPDQYEEVKNELKRVQRVFQVSPTPEAMNVLLENNLYSAYSITSIPKEVFVDTYSIMMGGDALAEATYERAAFMSTRAEQQAMKIVEYSNKTTPQAAQSPADYVAVQQALEDSIPNYAKLFGSPDICECDHCRSVYSAAAYLVDLLRFLWRGKTNHNGHNPLYMFNQRRPDILNLPLTCENTNTVIPYIDLVNEVMEYYTYHGTIDSGAAYDTGETTSEELRANPQNFEIEAYRKLKNRVYPFSLPYHQPLDVIRTYSDHLKTPRAEVMAALQQVVQADIRIDSEMLRISEEEFKTLTRTKFDGSADTDDANVVHPPYYYFGYTAPEQLESMAGTGVSDGIHEFLRRSGMKYTELVELISTKFINPHQSLVGYLEQLFADSTLDPNEIYTRLKNIESDLLIPENDPDIMAVLTPAGITSPGFIAWVKANLSNFDQIITLYQAQSMCNLDTTYLRTVANIYAGTDASGIDDSDNGTWSKIHRFIRLWRKLKWSIHELDLVLSALGQTDITATVISQLSVVSALAAQLKLPINQLAALWGNIDTYGAKSLYAKLFLNKAVQRIDASFKANEYGEYLPAGSGLISAHVPGILAAFRMSDEDLAAVIASGAVAPGDPLTLSNVSKIYRYAVLSKTLKLKVPDFCLVVSLFGAMPFSNPTSTKDFCGIAASIKKAGFKANMLQYIFNGTLSPESTIGINADKTIAAVRATHETFASIAQNYPDTPPSPLSAALIKDHLLLSFNADTVGRFMSFVESRQSFTVSTDPIVNVVVPVAYVSKYTAVAGSITCKGIMTDDEYTAFNTQVFSIITDLNLVVNIPMPLSAKYSYAPVSGTITCTGIMTEDEQTALSLLAGVTPNFENALGDIFKQCSDFKSALDSLFKNTNDYIKSIQSYDVVTTPNLVLTIPDMLLPKYSYVSASGRFICRGVMSTAEYNVLHLLGDAVFQAGVQTLYDMPVNFITENFSGVFSDMNAALITLLNRAAASETGIDNKLQLVYNKFLPLLRRKLREDSITQHIAPVLGLSEEATAVLIKADLQSFTDDLSKEGLSGEYFEHVTWLPADSKYTRRDAEINFNWGAASPGAPVPANDFSVRWDAYLMPASSGDYTLVVNLQDGDDIFKLYLDGAVVFSHTVPGVQKRWEFNVTLNASKMHKLSLEYADAAANAGISLSWKTATTAETIIPASALLPAVEINRFIQVMGLYYRAAKFISGFKLDEKELAHFIRFKVDFGNINFKALTPANWKRTNDYVQLRNDIPQTQATLIDLFAAAEMPNPVPTVPALIDLLALVTAWDKTALGYFVTTQFLYGVPDFKNEIALKRLNTAMALVSKTGLSATTLATWAVPATDFDALNITAQLVKSTVKAKYEEEDWLSVAGGLSDKIRENQKQALISYLLTRPELQACGVKDADGLFEYFLIDVQMDSCMDTSRIVQANASVQMFVNRCLLNLESNRKTGFETGVAPDAVNTTRWEWMKYYRVWEANRKVFLYPENWLEPEWRDDRSPFFKELESELVQNDITTRSVENAFRGYLAKLNDVANLDVCGSYQEMDGKQDLKLLHVVARTHNAPYHFYYRTWDKYRKWNAWEKIAVDIRSVEEGNVRGVHVIPIVWKERLFIFWPEFIEKSAPVTPYGNFHDVASAPPGDLKPLKYWEIRLAWTERVDGKWSPKQLTKEFVTIIQDDGNIPDPSVIFFKTRVRNNVLSIKPYIESLHPTGDPFDSAALGWHNFDYFRLSDIQARVEIVPENVSEDFQYDSASRYSINYEKLIANDELAYWGNTYLQNAVEHKVLFSSNTREKEAAAQEPFFYSDLHRTYFVRPTSTSIPAIVKDPGNYSPPAIDLVDDSYFTIPHIPHFEPDDYLPGEEFMGLDPFINPGSFFNSRGNKANTGIANAGILKTGMVTFSNSAAGAPDSEFFGGNANTGASTPMMFTRSANSDSDGDSGEMETMVSFMTSNTQDVQKLAYTNGSFGGVQKVNPGMQISHAAYVKTTGLEFHTFYHPHSSQFVTNLNYNGMKGLMESDTSIHSDNGSRFKGAYDPNFDYDLVKKAPEPDQYSAGEAYTYYKENICFDLFGANSIYNWELFFHAPLYIATRLSKNGKFEEAMKWFHYIFDPTTNELPLVGQDETARYWKVLPFKTTQVQTLEDWFRSNVHANTNPNPSAELTAIGEWRDNPFKPHLIARGRPLSYMKNVVLKYVENLVDWADSLFRMDTMETVNEALQIYVIANHILGPRPQFVPKRGTMQAETYESLKTRWDDFSNALVEMENIFPYSSATPVSDSDSGPGLLGIGPALYFCIPANDKLLGYWDTVADRLFKIRHCMNIDGAERKLALFAPAIDPGMLVNAAAQGLSLGSILGDLSSPPPIYRFSYMLQRANDFCSEVKALGGALLSALEKKDGEELGRLRASHEITMLELLTAVKERQVLEAKSNKEGLLKTRETAKFKLDHYTALLGNADVTVAGAPSVDAEINSESSLPADTNISVIKTDVDEALVESKESGVKLISREKADIDKGKDALISQTTASTMEGIASLLHVIPQIGAHATPFGVGAAVGFGGQQLGPMASGLAKIPAIVGAIYAHEAAQASKMAGYIRREQEWTLQANLAAKEIIQLDKQITSASIRIQVTEKELQNHKVQIQNSKEIEQFLKDKFTGVELYQWMKEQLFAVFKQGYNMAYDMAKKAEKCYRYELGNEITNFIQYGYWDNTYQGLCSGEKLHIALRQLEKSFLEENKRELELVKHVSVALLNPLALQQLIATGKCNVTIPEEIFDLDYPGHYFRRLKSVSLSIPCVGGPYTTVSCTLRLMKNSIRTKTTMNLNGTYEHENDEGIWIDDERFRSSNVPVKAIATSSGQRDTGMFELSFKDDRYLPFEGAGAISEWKIELTSDAELRQFDYSTISDVIIHLSYTAREDGGLFKEGAVTYLKSYFTNTEAKNQPLMRMFSMKHDFSTEWYKFLHPAAPGGEQLLQLNLKPDHFPFFASGRKPIISKIDVLLKSTKSVDYHLILSGTLDDDILYPSQQKLMSENATFGNMQKTSINGGSGSLDLSLLNIFAPMTVKIKQSSKIDYTQLSTNPDELMDVFVVLHYALE